VFLEILRDMLVMLAVVCCSTRLQFTHKLSTAMSNTAEPDMAELEVIAGESGTYSYTMMC
jgi:hypothetical protein